MHSERFRSSTWCVQLGKRDQFPITWRYAQQKYSSSTLPPKRLLQKQATYNSTNFNCSMSVQENLLQMSPINKTNSSICSKTKHQSEQHGYIQVIRKLICAVKATRDVSQPLHFNENMLQRCIFKIKRRWSSLFVYNRVLLKPLQQKLNITFSSLSKQFLT